MRDGKRSLVSNKVQGVAQLLSHLQEMINYKRTLLNGYSEVGETPGQPIER